jgi:hypothetical protein
MPRLPDSTRASDLILAGRDRQAMHALLNLQRRVFQIMVAAMDDQSVAHQQAHTVDGVRRTAEWRRYHAGRVRRLEAMVDLLGGL